MNRAFALLLLAATTSLGAQAPLSAAQMSRIDSIFAPYAALDVPGCALGVSRHDSVILERAWGSADLEHSVAITPATIFEAGSVSKQFTAAAIFRLAQQGKLSLDSSVRKYLPELPAYTTPITLRHMIHHTSGLRDWGTVMAIAGWPRGTRTYTQAHVLEIVARQTALNFPVGAEYQYSNSNYNLLAMIAERVSGKTLAEFTRTEIFEPLGMTSTGWRDDYTRIVKGRAQGYSGTGKQWRLDMPFENVYGNSSLLTTVGDLLKWSANFASHRVGGEDFVAMQLQPGKLSTGRPIAYAGGVVVGSAGGTLEIVHDGATAGYRAFLARYPDAGYSVAMLCNAGNVDARALGSSVVEVVVPLWSRPKPAQSDQTGLILPDQNLTPILGAYAHVRTDEPLNLVLEKGRLRIKEGPPLVAVSETHFTMPGGRTHLVFDAGPEGKRGRFRVWADGDTTEYRPVGPPVGSDRSADFAGEYYSAETDAKLFILAEKGEVIMFNRPTDRTALKPVYADGFISPWGSVFRFTRKNGKVDGFSVTSGRVRNLRFDKKT